jgi:hypothetical protein
MARPRSEFLHQLEQALVADIRPEVELAMKAGALLSRGHSRAEIADITEASSAEVRAAVKRLKRVAGELDGGCLPPDLKK